MFFAPQGRHVAPMGVKFGMEEGTGGDFGPLLHAKFHPRRCNDKGVSPGKRAVKRLRYDAMEYINVHLKADE